MSLCTQVSQHRFHIQRNLPALQICLRRESVTAHGTCSDLLALWKTSRVPARSWRLGQVDRDFAPGQCHKQSSFRWINFPAWAKYLCSSLQYGRVSCNRLFLLVSSLLGTIASLSEHRWLTSKRRHYRGRPDTERRTKSQVVESISKKVWHSSLTDRETPVSPYVLNQDSWLVSQAYQTLAPRLLD